MRLLLALFVGLALSRVAEPFATVEGPSRGATVVVRGALSGEHRWSRGARVRLEGVVTLSAGARLFVEAGTVVEAEPGAGIIVDRSSRIDARGTQEQPIVLRCAGGTAVSGCWLGVILAGNAPVRGGTPTSPPVRGTGASGCAELSGDVAVGRFGGCDAADSSGTLRYVRIEHASRGLELLGVGRGTVLDHLQIHGSSTHGVLIRGGAARLKRVLSTASAGPGWRWSDGWSGAAQFVAVQRIAADGTALVQGDGAPVTSPPQLRNLTLAAVGSSSALQLTGAAASTLHNVLAVGGGSLIDLDGSAACEAATIGAVDLRSVVAVGVMRLDADDDDADCGSASGAEGVVLAAAPVTSYSMAEMAALMHQPLAAVLPDFRFRPTASFPLGTSAPIDGFFSAPAAEVGAFGAAFPLAQVPWYSGWSTDGDPPRLPFGSLTGVLLSTEGAPIGGATIVVSGADQSGVTSASGGFTVSLVRPGTRTIRAEGLPAGCASVDTVASIPADDVVSLTMRAACGPVTIVPSAIRLTYICGNTFRARNGNAAPVSVTWDVFGAGETGTLLLPPRPLTGTASETFFTTTATGTVRLFYEGSQVDVKANGGSVCAP